MVCTANSSRGLERAFPREQVLILLYEACCDDPARFLKQTYAFLGLDDDFVPSLLRRAVSETAAPTPLDERVRTQLAEQYAADLASLAASHPDLDLEIWPSARQNVVSRPSAAAVSSDT